MTRDTLLRAGETGLKEEIWCLLCDGDSDHMKHCKPDEPGCGSDGQTNQSKSFKYTTGQTSPASSERAAQDC